jgi:hypothetical protein
MESVRDKWTDERLDDLNNRSMRDFATYAERSATFAGRY